MTDHAPPPDELRALIDLEAGARSEPSLEVRARLAERLAVALAPAPLPAPSVPRPPLGKLAAATALFGSGAAVGALVHAVVATPVERVEVRYVDRVVEVERPAPPPSEPAVSPAPPSAVPAPAPARPARVRDLDLGAESALLDRARSALARGDAEAALSAITEHARSFPRGQLGEAREALAVQALVEAGRAGEARARAERFRARFPDSSYAPVVEAALARLPR
jgi:hypothetical protein